jgi:glycine dehydrogenase subunit 1
MPYQPHTDEDRARMLSALGIDSVARLFDDIPESVRANGLGLPAPEPEQLLSRRAERLAARNRTDLAAFLGAGVYRHFIPAAVDQVISRGEFATAYTPYQPEVSQGTLQTIYEYQSLIAELTGLPVVSASHYDGAAATAEAILMAVRATGRGRVLARSNAGPRRPARLRDDAARARAGHPP